MRPSNPIESGRGPDLNAKLARASKSETSNRVKVCVYYTYVTYGAAAATASRQYRIPDGDGMYGDGEPYRRE